MLHHFFGLNLQSLQIRKRVHRVELTGVNQAHVDIAHLSALGRFIEHRVLAVKNRSFETALTNIMPRPKLCRVEVV